ncbi:hypothetical protein, partial [Streptomyces griseus]|uniref:hypothetical protein n=1 Tax=Streptomyces griseus TaxID=1911 RepID=UPI003456520A
FGPSVKLDIEAEVGFVVGVPSAHGTPVVVARRAALRGRRQCDDRTRPSAVVSGVPRGAPRGETRQVVRGGRAGAFSRMRGR